MWRSSKIHTLRALDGLQSLLMSLMIEVVFPAHVLDEALDTFHLGEIILEHLPDFSKRLYLVRRYDSHDAMHMRCIVALVLRGSPECLRHSMRTTKDACIVAELVLAWSHMNTLLCCFVPQTETVVRAAVWAM